MTKILCTHHFSHLMVYPGGFFPLSKPEYNAL